MAVSAPVLSSQSTHTFKLPGVVRDNNQSPAACVTGNHLIEWPDRASLTGKLCPDLPRMGGGRRVIIQNIKSGNKPLYHSEISFGHLAFFGTVNQLHQGDRADTHSPLVQVKTLPDAGRFVFYRENADVSIQHKLQHQNDSRSCTEGCSRLSIKSALTLFPSNHSSHDSPAGVMIRVRPTAITSTRFTCSGNATAFGSLTA
ncbi:TrbH protein (plasmid) [Salmonella enterica subsp. enterica serovar Choleraesuis str. SCSA50]|uniref:TrbH protein n=2 Tax=Salmonella enterica subsp. enterica serovar Choleraesuis TaxID=119912 RepID=Q5J498_SALCH|nr:TrbH protein [Salmonella enterica subsp. enterica serovar Choleraesuis str. SC-B67]EFZ04573.1 TrbH protein [Salmonella enterica subsp. enterica serovar Choleraesuis str. SCSA50]